MSETYVIIFHVKPDKRECFRALLDPVLEAVCHEATFVHAALHVDPGQPNRLLLHETCTNSDDVLNVQLHRPYRVAWHAALDDLLERPREIEIWIPIWSGADRPACGEIAGH